MKPDFKMIAIVLALASPTAAVAQTQVAPAEGGAVVVPATPPPAEATPKANDAAAEDPKAVAELAKHHTEANVQGEHGAADCSHQQGNSGTGRSDDCGKHNASADHDASDSRGHH